MIYTQISWLCLLLNRTMDDGNFTSREYGFSTFLLLWPWLWPDDLHIRTWPVFSEDTPDVQIWTSDVKTFQNYRQTDTHMLHEDRQTDTTQIITPLRRWSKICDDIARNTTVYRLISFSFRRKGIRQVLKIRCDTKKSNQDCHLAASEAFYLHLSSCDMILLLNRACFALQRKFTISVDL